MSNDNLSRSPEGTSGTERQRSSLGWIGPVLAAVIAVGGYIGYQEWRRHQEPIERCAELERQFSSNMNAMQGPIGAAIGESRRVGNQQPMGTLADAVEENRRVMNQLNADCPGWIEGKYR